MSEVEEIPDKNIFMMCESLNRGALTLLPPGYHVRSCRQDEFGTWKVMPFDSVAEAEKFDGFMEDFFQATYGGKEDQFFENTLFVCDEQDQPIATCLLWKAYDAFNTIHWLKVLKPYEGKGIGRAILSIIMKDLSQDDYPVYLHTQPESYRAIGLYADFGFKLLSDKKIGTRENHLEECLPYLKKHMGKHFDKLEIKFASSSFLKALETENESNIQF